ncbi:Ras family protein [Trichomonas vaginalis G3]|uniref:Ras family protein n=1 Tax=Trichomonas vaginalis (strain ATCC PRA-98 / G3) TaxID=412133 RepID=A2FE96_TRIV3|nr:regulation of endocytosis [Trichomonas vaginalis G3]EAX96787.1 Ras family protein [Trichomonas vaginalis G3]KAI5552829.1 regulation of endocytosis [Trichomonas vaginalis G3]|eukprot:XP_001309717.1 Ras family protein [Trichomonas vaginalis G3]
MSSTQNSYKVVVVGSSGVGKTAIVQRLVDGTFSDEGQSTVGVEFKSHSVTFDDEVMKLSIWDTAGQERFRSVSKAYFRNAVGAILVFSLDDAQSFSELDGWLNDLHALSTPNAVILLVGNKADIADKVVTTAEAEAFSKRHGLEYLETSAKDGVNINDTFVRLARAINEKVKKGELRGTFQAPSTSPIGPRPVQATPSQGGCNC